MATTETADNPEVTAEGEAKEKPKLALEVKIDKPSACQRHVTVTISRPDVERYVSEQFDELSPKAELPGFRPGRAPRKLVEKQFKEQVHEQVKGKLLMDSLTQISDEHEFSAISEPDFDFDAVEIPDDGPLVFEFDIEVRPEFDLPQWKGLRLKRAVHEYAGAEVDSHLRKLLAKYSTLVPQEGPVEDGEGEFVKLTATFRDGESVVSTLPEEMIEVRPTLSFSDGKLAGFDKLMIGKRAGDIVETRIKLSDDAENDALRGKEVAATLQILEVKRRKLPELDDGFLDRIGGFSDEAELRDEVRKELERQLKYQQQRMVRQQITGLLTVAADWELPRELLKRQARRELERYVMELQASGFTPDQINARANELKQNIMKHTALSLKEHFILERIAEEEKIDAAPEDYDAEIELIAEQMDESPRRVRAKLEKRGQIDTLRNQIVERKVIDLINSHATFEDVPYDRPQDEATAVAFAIAGTDAAAHIPEAKHAGSGEENVPGSHVQEKKDKS
jgi:trigger factor